MAHIKKISTTLSVAATVLLEACSSSSSDPGLSLSPNTKAPELIGTWQSNCTIIPSAAKNIAATFVGASGAGGGGSGGSSSGDAFRYTAVFNQNGLAVLSMENFATTNCNANTRVSSGRFESAYIVGDATIANDGSPATEINYNTATSTTYSIFQIINNNDLYIGDENQSSPGNNGSSETARYDGVGVRLSKL